MNTELMPTGRNTQHCQTKHISLEKADWKMHLQAISILLYIYYIIKEGFFKKIKTLHLTYMEAGNVLSIQGLVDR